MGTLNSRCRIIIGTQKRTIILTTTHEGFHGLCIIREPEHSLELALWGGILLSM